MIVYAVVEGLVTTIVGIGDTMKIKTNRKKPWIAKRVSLYGERFVNGAVKGVYVRPNDQLDGWRHRIVRGWRTCEKAASYANKDTRPPRHCLLHCPSSGMTLLLGAYGGSPYCPDRLSSYSNSPHYTRWRPILTDEVRAYLGLPKVHNFKQLNL